MALITTTQTPKTAKTFHWRRRLIASASAFIFVFTFMPQRSFALVDPTQLFRLLTVMFGFIEGIDGGFQNSIEDYLALFTNDISGMFSRPAIDALESTNVTDKTYPFAQLRDRYKNNVAGRVNITRTLTNDSAIEIEAARLVAEALDQTNYFLTESGGLNIEQQLENIEVVGDLLNTLALLIPAATAACSASIFGSSTCSAIQGIIAQINAIRGALESQVAATEVAQDHVVNTQQIAALSAQLKLLSALLSHEQFKAIQAAPPTARTMPLVIFQTANRASINNP
jgi:hypothetical protein